MEISRTSNLALLRLLEGADEHGLEDSVVLKIRRTVSFLQDVEHEDELRSTPSWKAGRLTHDDKGVWSLPVGSRWRILFRIERGAIVIMDLMKDTRSEGK